jgi:predicted small metal-binding protein
MRAVDCPCGLTLTGTDDEELFALARAHADDHHADQDITDEFIGDHIRDNARDA